MRRQSLIWAAAVLMLVTAWAGATTTTEWTEYAANPVYSPGKAYYPTILKEGGTYLMWSDGASGLQFSTSSDGISWTSTVSAKTGLSSSASHATVEKIGSEYRIWYWSGTLYSIGDIRTAVSSDGLTWTNDQAITQFGTTVIAGGNNSSTWNRGSYGPADILYNPSGSDTIVDPVDEASVWANKFVMYYDGTTGGAESLGLAVSNDGLYWVGYQGGASAVFAGAYVSGAWDYNYASRGTVIKVSDDLYYLWYSGGNGAVNQGIGFASSTDGINWTRDAENPIFHKSDGVAWRSARTYTPMVIGDEMWFTGVSSSNVYTIGYATGAGGVVPEPISLIFFGTGLAGIFMARRPRRKLKG